MNLYGYWHMSEEEFDAPKAPPADDDWLELECICCGYPTHRPWWRRSRHRRTDPACRYFREPATQLGRWWFDRNRGRSCDRCRRLP